MVRRLSFSLFLASASLFGFVTPSYAQSTEQPSAARSEEIVVTARKRAESLQDVPFSIVAQSEEKLRDLGVGSLPELSRNIAGLTITDLGPGQSQVAIRGISAGQVVRDQPGVREQVGIYLDESVISVALFTPDLDLFDLDRVEVLRGPQGTLFGAGSLSGTLRYITNQPDAQRYEGAFETGFQVVDGGDIGYSVKGALNIPLIEDKLAVRFVGFQNELPGFIDAVQPDGSVVEDVNDGQKFGGRVALLWSPTPNLSITPRFAYQKIDTDGFPRFDAFNFLVDPRTSPNPISLGERQQFTQLEEGLFDEIILGDLNIKYDLGPVTLSSITTYTDRFVLVTRDATQLTGSVTVSPLSMLVTGAGAPVFPGIDLPEDALIDGPLFDETNLRVITQEARIASNNSDKLQWLAGVFYQSFNRQYGQTLQATGFDQAIEFDNTDAGSFPDVPFLSAFNFDFRQVAIFGEATYAFTDRLRFTAGLRWFDFREDRNLFFGGLFADATPPEGVDGSTSSDGLTPRVILEYDQSENVQLTAQISRGFRLGGINDPLNAPLCSDSDLVTFGNRPTFDDERTWNYEAGAKTSWLNGKAVVNVAAFYTDINDLQATIDAGSCSSRIVFNVPNARSVGFETELFFRPTANWDFGIAATYVDAELRSTLTSTDEDGVTTVIPGFVSGNRLPTAPQFQFAANVTYERPVWSNFDGFFTFTFQHVGSSFTQIGDQAAGVGPANPDFIGLTPDFDPVPLSFETELDAYQIGNLRLGVRNGRYEIAAFVNNLWDERAELSLDRERGGSARVGFLTNQPRTFGLTARADF